MGGSIGLTIRAPDGEEHRMCRWTNILPEFLNNLALVNKNPEHTKEILKEWQKMREDYLTHETEWARLKAKYQSKAWDHAPFEYNMTPVYAPFPFLAPNDYGLVVVDMVNNQILDSQGYSRIGKIHATSILNDMHAQLRDKPTGYSPKKQDTDALKAFDSGDEFSSAMRFRRFYDAGKVAKAIDQNEREIALNGKSLNDAICLIQADGAGLNGSKFIDFVLDMSPFRITRYEEHNAKSAVAMRKKIEELGFKLSDEERAIWDEWVQEHS